jgi:hypothetical protein
MSDLLFMTMTLIGATGVCFAKPCSPEHWRHVKAAHPDALPAPASARGDRPSTPGSTRDWTDELVHAHA